jgi:hypothetical protein
MGQDWQNVIGQSAREGVGKEVEFGCETSRESTD